MVVVERSIDIAAPQEMVFEYVSDHRNVPRYMDKVTSIQAIGRQVSGLGSRYRWEVLVRGLKLGAEFEVVEFKPHEWMAAVTTSGPKSRGWWRIRSHNGGTRVTLAAAYELPRILLVKLIGGRVIEREIGSIFETSLRRLRANLESKRQESSLWGRSEAAHVD